MGYSVSVKFKNDEQKNLMNDFLVENKSLLEKMKELEIMGSGFFNNVPEDGENLGYAPNKKFLLGFHGSTIPRYIWDLCAWMSVKANAKEDGDYYFFYDDEKMIVTKDRGNTQNTIVDERGIRVVAEEATTGLLNKAVELLLNKKENFKKQNELFEELEEKWNSFVLLEKAQTGVKKNKP